MKICVISTTILPALPMKLGGYGGLEFIAWATANGLARRGHEVLLVAPKGSACPDGATIHETTIGESELQSYSGYWQKLTQQDIVIDHTWFKCSYLLKAEGVLKIPILGVCHAPIETMYQSPPPVEYPCLVGISQDMTDNISAHLGVPARTAYNGLDIDFYKNNGEARTDRYLFLARMSKIKGPHIAVDLARKFRFPLDLVGDDKITGDPEYAQRLYNQAKSSLNIKYHGGISRQDTIGFYSRAKIMLHMNKSFREPFGMAPVEAQLCGLPVIAYDNGAMRETILHGKTGFVCKTDAEVEAVIKDDLCASIKPEDCRDWASQFSLSNMISGYEKLIQEAKDMGW